MTIDSVVWAQYINVTEKHTDSHVATAIAAPKQYASGGKNVRMRANEKLPPQETCPHILSFRDIRIQSHKG